MGEIIVAPIQAVRRRTGTQRETPLETYRQREWETALDVLNGAIERLTWLRDLGHPLLGPRLEPLLSGTSRAEPITRVREAHQQVDFEAELQSLIEDYRRGTVPLIVPITLLRHHVRRLGVAYLAGQVYLDPHPRELMLRNHV